MTDRHLVGTVMGVEDVEDAYGKPVISAATATAWSILTDLGLPAEAPNAGSLLSGRH